MANMINPILHKKNCSTIEHCPISITSAALTTLSGIVCSSLSPLSRLVSAETLIAPKASPSCLIDVETQRSPSNHSLWSVAYSRSRIFTNSSRSISGSANECRVVAGNGRSSMIEEPEVDSSRVGRERVDVLCVKYAVDLRTEVPEQPFEVPHVSAVPFDGSVVEPADWFDDDPPSSNVPMHTLFPLASKSTARGDIPGECHPTRQTSLGSGQDLYPPS